MTLSRAELAGLDWATVQTATDDELERRLYAPPAGTEGAGPPRPVPDCAWIDLERRKREISTKAAAWFARA